MKSARRQNWSADILVRQRAQQRSSVTRRTTQEDCSRWRAQADRMSALHLGVFTAQSAGRLHGA
jgi:hypothetical protein